ncbi:MAG: ATP-binding cassette domain-containing protein [Bacilli bacterium]|nr:ATP-binding cassette domain-containing protein [Bacilli bacterium]
MKVVLQDGSKDCGICSLLSIIKHHGGNVSKEYLRELTNTTKNGVTAYNLIQAGEKLGFDSFALSGNVEEINLSNLPCIAHVVIKKSYHHFVVIYEVDFKKQKVVLMDPAKGKRIVTFSEFKLMTSNIYIFFIPKKKIPVFIDNKLIKDTITNYFKNNKKLLICISYLTISYFIFHILSAFHFKYLLDFCIEYKISNNIGIISLVVLSLYLLKEISFYLRNILLLKYSQILDYIITTKTYQQLILLPYLYYKNRTTGEVLSRIKDLSLVKNYIVKLFVVCSSDIFSVIIFIIFLFHINIKMTLFSCLLFFLLIILNLIFKAELQLNLRKYYRKEEKLNSYLIESLSSVEVIKGMHTEKLIVDKLKIKYKNFLETIYQLSSIQEFFSFITKSINHVFLIIILGFGSYNVINNNMSLGQLIVYQSILNFLNLSINNIIDLVHEYPNYKISRERVEDLFNIKKENFLGSSYYSNCNLIGDIKFNNLNYSYNNQIILKNINLKITPKDKIFICGPSGTGKSTLVKLLMRYLEVPYGKLSINDIDINHYHLDILRNDITYVSQQEFLFTDTIYNNITLEKDYDKEKVEHVMKLTLVNEFNKDYNQLVEENGFNFSGGERQRIILARTILKESSIYIFDEALSQIDVERERKILKNIFKYLKDKTVIIISHRFDNKDLFDRVLELKDGNIYEEKL